MKKFSPPLLLGFLALGAIYFFYGGNSSKDPDTLTLYGNVDIREVQLSFRVPGRVETMAFEEGDNIAKGQVIGTLDKEPYDDDITRLEALVEQRRYEFENAKVIYKRKKKLLSTDFASREDTDNAYTAMEAAKSQWDVSKAELDQAQINLRDTELKAPKEGVILTRVQEPGAVVAAGQPVYRLSLHSPIWVRAYVEEPDLGKIFSGMKAQVTTDSDPDKVYEGQVGFISPVAEFTPKTVETTELRTRLVYRLRIYIENRDRYLRQGMPVTVTLKRDQAHGANHTQKPY